MERVKVVEEREPVAVSTFDGTVAYIRLAEPVGQSEHEGRSLRMSMSLGGHLMFTVSDPVLGHAYYEVSPNAMSEAIFKLDRRLRP